MKKDNVLLSVLVTLLILIFPIISGAIITLKSLGEFESRLVQGISFALASLIGVLIARRIFKDLKLIGCKSLDKIVLKDFLYFIPILVIELSSLVFGFRQGLDGKLVLVLLFFIVFVAITEELYFRGIIFNLLNNKSLTFGIVLSSILFSLGHFANLLAGAGFF